MKRPIFIIVLLVLVFGVIAVMVFYPGNSEKDLSARPSYQYPLSVKGISHKYYKQGTLMSRVDIDEFIIRPRRFLLFNVKSVNEAILTNVTAELYDRESESEAVNKKNENQGIDLLNAIVNTETISRSEAGLLTRVKIKGVAIKIYNSDALTHILKASSGRLSIKDKKTVFYNAILENPPSNKIINARKIIWDQQKQVFKITGFYKILSGKGVVDGKGLLIDMNFNMEHLYLDR